jgi:hypothetical protein
MQIVRFDFDANEYAVSYVNDINGLRDNLIKYR